MTVSQIFIRAEVFDASVNWEIFKLLQQKENEKIGGVKKQI